MSMSRLWYVSFLAFCGILLGRNAQALSVSNMTPPDGAYVTSSVFIYASYDGAMYYDDDSSAYEYGGVVTVWLDGGMIGTDNNMGSFGFFVDNLADGPHSVAFSDQAGNGAGWGFTVATTPPALSNISPPDGSYNSGAWIAISASYFDLLSGPLSVYFDGQPVGTNDSGSSFDFTVQGLSDGSHSIAAFDFMGNSAGWSFNVDSTSPTISINSPADGSYTNAFPYISASYSDNNFGPLLVYLDGMQISVNDYGSSFDFFAQYLPEGIHVITVSDQVGNFSNTSWTFNVGWSSGGSLANLRSHHTATLLPSGIVLVTGGQGNLNYLASAELYDPVSNTWSATGSLSAARRYHTATLLPSGNVLVVGGDGDSGLLDSAELYDPVSNTWSAAGNLADARSAHTATLLPNGNVIVVGGYGNTGILGSAELYDPVSNTWSVAEGLSVARCYHTVMPLPNGNVLVVGGVDLNSSPLDSAELYDPVSNTWSAGGGLTTARYSQTMTLLPNGNVLLVGGVGLNSSPLDSAELYDPVSNTWSTVGSLATRRYSHSATLLPSGNVVVAGGVDLNSSPLGSAELYDPVLNTWSATGSFTTARYSQTMTLLASGNVLVAGGGNPDSLDSVELYGAATIPPMTISCPSNQVVEATSADGAVVSYASATATDIAPLMPLFSYGIASGSTFPVGVTTVNVIGVDATDNTTTASFTVTVRQTSLAFSVQPTNVPPDRSILPAISVSLKDQNGNIETDRTDSVTLAIGTNPAGGTLSGTLTNAAVNGVAVFSGLKINMLGVGYTVQASAIGLDTVVSSPFDVIFNPWSPAGSLATARYLQTMTLLPSGKVLVAGGYNSGYLNSAQLYDPVSNTWSAAGSLANARYYHTATLLSSGKVLVVGGRGNSGPLNSAELYDPMSNTWSAAGNLATARFAHTATLLPSGKVLVVGGYNFVSGTLNSAYLYDPVSNTWSATGNLADARWIHTSTLLPSGKVLVAGGQGNNGVLHSAELYDPMSNTWSAAGNLATARFEYTATLLSSGKVLVAGGYNYNSPLASVELYDPVLNTWSAARNLDAAHYSHAATLLPGGNVLVVGGYNFNSGVLDSVELYDPVSDTWSSAGRLATARYLHSATLLPSGKVLVTGGYNYNSGPLNSVELYGVTTTPPMTISCPPNQEVDATSVDGAVISYASATATDIVPIVRLFSYSKSSGSAFPLGVTTVNVIGVDATDNTTTASFTVTVHATTNNGPDTTPPVVFPPANIVLEATSSAGAFLLASSFGTASALDDVTHSSSMTITYNHAATEKFPIGVTTVTASATDEANNTGTATFTVTVRDTTPPVVVPPSNIVIEAISPAGALVPGSSFGTASAMDAVTPSTLLNITYNHAATETFPIGITTVIASATDEANNTGTATFTVTVHDTTKPVVTPPPNLVVEATSVQGAVVANFGSASTTDAVTQNPVITFAPAAASTFALGVTHVTVSAKDAANNIGTATFTVTVRRTALQFSVQPSTVIADISIAPAVVVSFVDQNGIVETDRTDSVTLAIRTNPGSGALSGTGTVAAVNGVATFSGVSLNKAGNGYSLQASAGLSTAVSSQFNVLNPLPVITSLTPSNCIAGSADTNIAVAGNNFVSGAVVKFNATNISTAFVNSSQLVATVPTSLLATAGNFDVVITSSTGSSAPKSFIVSNPPPSITLTNQPNGYNNNDNNMNQVITGYYIDDGSQWLSGVAIFDGETEIDSGSVVYIDYPGDGTQSFSAYYSAPTLNGGYTVNFIFTTVDGLTYTSSQYMLFDSLPPQFSYIQPANEETPLSNGANAILGITDSFSGVAQVWIYDLNTNVAIPFNNVDGGIVVHGLQSGTYSFAVNALDNAGNASVFNWNFSVLAVSITIQSPADQQGVYGPDVPIYGTFSGIKQQQLVSLDIRIHQDISYPAQLIWLDETTGLFSATVPELTAGWNWADAIVTSSSGEQEQTGVSFLVFHLYDPPNMTFVDQHNGYISYNMNQIDGYYPDNGSYWLSDVTIFNGETEIASTSGVSVYYSGDGKQWFDAAYTVPTALNGGYTVNFIFTTSEGLTFTSTQYLQFDNRPPEAAYLNPPDANTPFNVPTATLLLFDPLADDGSPGSGVDPATISVIDNATGLAVAWYATDSGIETTVNGLADGVYDYWVTASDFAGNSTSFEWRFTVIPASRPYLAFTSPADGAYLTNSGPNIEGYFNSQSILAIDINSFTVTLIGTDGANHAVTPIFDPNGSSFTLFPVDTLPEDTYTLTATIADVMQNVSLPAIWHVKILTLAIGSSIDYASDEVHFGGTSGTLDLPVIEVYVDGVLIDNTDTADVTFSCLDLSNGPHDVVVFAWDSVGNSIVNEFEMTVLSGIPWTLTPDQPDPNQSNQAVDDAVPDFSGIVNRYY